MENIKPMMLELYSMHVADYLKYMRTSHIISDLSNSNIVIYHGWKLMTQVFAILHSLKYNKQQMHEKLIHSYYLYLEYVEKIHVKHMCESISPSAFVYKQIIGDICLNTPPIVSQNNNTYFIKLTKWCELILLWNNSYFTFDQRVLCIQTFLYLYLTTMCKDKYYHCFRMLEILQEHWKDKHCYSELHIRILYEFYANVQNNDPTYLLNDVQDRCFVKFIQETETLDNLICDASESKQVKKLVEWMFAPLRS